MPCGPPEKHRLNCNIQDLHDNRSGSGIPDRNTMYRSTSCHNTTDHRRMDRNNMYVNSASNGHQSSGPNTGYPIEYHRKGSDMKRRDGGSGTDDVSRKNLPRHRNSPVRMNRCHRTFHQ